MMQSWKMGSRMTVVLVFLLLVVLRDDDELRELQNGQFCQYRTGLQNGITENFSPRIPPRERNYILVQVCSFSSQNRTARSML